MTENGTRTTGHDEAIGDNRTRGSRKSKRAPAPPAPSTADDSTSPPTTPSSSTTTSNNWSTTDERSDMEKERHQGGHGDHGTEEEDLGDIGYDTMHSDKGRGILWDGESHENESRTEELGVEESLALLELKASCKELQCMEGIQDVQIYKTMDLKSLSLLHHVTPERAEREAEEEMKSIESGLATADDIEEEKTTQKSAEETLLLDCYRYQIHGNGSVEPLFHVTPPRHLTDKKAVSTCAPIEVAKKTPSLQVVRRKSRDCDAKSFAESDEIVCSIEERFPLVKLGGVIIRVSAIFGTVVARIVVGEHRFVLVHTRSKGRECFQLWRRSQKPKIDEFVAEFRKNYRTSFQILDSNGQAVGNLSSPTCDVSMPQTKFQDPSLRLIVEGHLVLPLTLCLVSKMALVASALLMVKRKTMNPNYFEI
ncbi:unnamed protein product [Cyprideis torosa]|uniref:Uncharacterized protein n=1 Tax=Cyprideis torosa TaxID=163714 RepID=A0A7R8WFI0_9CRUS|nr:unnamed protein product [Cyprideis torosa]CAG0891891.1 unnamed protein product [Cyprideis torosa]